ncbi:MAG TPA: HD domain-containing phosphohydrolase [Polyangiaceae bacterium]
METTARLRILCVDDEPNVLEGLSLHLRRRYDVLTATSGAAALELLGKDDTIAVVISDMRMPNMDGSAFLSKARQSHPLVVRMLLTGQADMQSAISAVNDGQIFRFLTKPCPPPQLLAAADAAAEQYRLVTGERVLLEQTLHGSVRILSEVLSLAKPLAFGRANRLKGLVSAIAEKIGASERWPVEIAAMLSQLGCVSLPDDVAEKLHSGVALDEAEQKMVDRIPDVTEQLLGNIPRLELVRGILTRFAKAQRADEPLPDDSVKRTIELGARLLRVAYDYDVLEAQGYSSQRALDTLRGRANRYDPAMLTVLADLRSGAAAGEELRELPLAGLREGMVLVDDLRLLNGALLCARGYEVTAGFLQRAKNFRPGSVKEPVRVMVR